MLRARLVLAVSVIVLALPASATADAYQAVEQAYAKSATIPPCRFSSHELEAALRAAPTYDVEYFGDFTAAVQSTLAEQASGRCGRRHAASGAPVPGLTPPGRPPGLPSSVTAGGSAAIPLPLLIALLAGLLGAGAAGAAVVGRRLGWWPGWVESAGHAWGEIEYRLSGTWAEVRDWLRA